MKPTIGMKKYGEIGYLHLGLKFVTESVESTFAKGMARNTPRRTCQYARKNIFLRGIDFVRNEIAIFAVGRARL
jgi:hypothetical protein